MTEEAKKAISDIKELLKTQTLLYNVNLNQPLYLATDAFQVGVGSVLYQLNIYDKNPEGMEKCLSDHNYLPDEGAGQGVHLLPGVSPGRQTPVVDEFLKEKADMIKHDICKALNSNETMTEKIDRITQEKIIVVKVVAFYSRLFSQAQIAKYSAMEKEFLGLMISILHFREYLEAAPITYVLSDCQAVLWAAKHRNEHIKLTRYLLKLFELNINFVITHVSGSRNSVADFLSRFYEVTEEKPKKKGELGPKSAQHIVSPFSPLQVISKEEIIKAFNADCVVPCSMPNFCHLDCNSTIFRGLGPFEFKPNVCKKISQRMGQFGLTPSSLSEKLTIQNIISEQNLDPELEKIIDRLQRGVLILDYKLEKGILKKKLRDRNSYATVIPKTLIPTVLALFHFNTHSGYKKLVAHIRTQYWWSNMAESAVAFTKGCILCSIMKHQNTGKTELGVPRLVPLPRHTWQIDICQALPSVKSITSFLNCTDMYSGYCVPLPLKNETSDHIAEMLEEHIFKIFGPPKFISSDNAQNLQGPAIKKLYNFYNVKHLKTTAYSPQSHGLVENMNKNVLQMLRILSEQFRTPWLNVLSLAVILINTLPRTMLQGYSPFFLMFGHEPFDPNVDAEKNLDLKNYVDDTLNNMNFVKILREILLSKRLTKNQKRGFSYKSFPTGTLVYVKNFSNIGNRKMKNVFLRSPEKVIKEYLSTVYTIDILGRVRKVSKNNIKRAGNRSLELFSALPENIQMILGEKMDSEVWDQMVKNDEIPLHLQDYSLDFEPDVKTRGQIAKHSHLLEDPEHHVEGGLVGNGVDDQLDVDLEDNQLLLLLQSAHDQGLLTRQDMTLTDLPKLGLEPIPPPPPRPRSPSPTNAREGTPPPRSDRVGGGGGLLLVLIRRIFCHPVRGEFVLRSTKANQKIIFAFSDWMKPGKTNTTEIYFIGSSHANKLFLASKNLYSKNFKLVNISAPGKRFKDLSFPPSIFENSNSIVILQVLGNDLFYRRSVKRGPDNKIHLVKFDPVLPSELEKIYIQLAGVIRRIRGKVFLIDNPIRHSVCCPEHKNLEKTRYQVLQNRKFRTFFNILKLKNLTVLDHSALLDIPRRVRKSNFEYYQLLKDSVHFFLKHYINMAKNIRNLIEK